MSSEHLCAGCKKVLPEEAFHRNWSDPLRAVTARCRACRSESYYEKRYPDICACCQKHRPIQSNKQCRGCNREAGLRECKVCLEIKPLFLSFHGASRRCKTCSKPRA